MKFNFNYILLTATLLLSFGAKAQQVFGIVQSIDSSKVVPLANFVNSSSGKKFIANRSGFFRISLSAADSVKVTAIGYETIELMGKDIIPENSSDTIVIYLKPKAYQLKDVNIIYSNKRRDSIAELAAEYLKNDPLMNNYDRVLNRPQGGLFNPLTALYNEYSKEGKDMRKFEEFMRHAEMLKQVNYRYNKKSIKRATSLPEEYLDDYILFCQIDRAFVLNASDYDLILAMRKCATKFRAAKVIED